MNDLDAAANFERLCSEDAATGNLLLRPGVPIGCGGWLCRERGRERGRELCRAAAAPRHASRVPPRSSHARSLLLDALEDRAEDLVLEYFATGAAVEPPLAVTAAGGSSPVTVPATA